jgi:nicotinic acid mononucleotide adenylyltransferase
MEEIPSGVFKQEYDEDAEVAVIVGKDYLKNLE